MPKNKQVKDVFLTLGLRNSDSRSNLQSVEIIGIPGRKNRDGECSIDVTTERFFDDVIAKQIFRSSNRLKDCKFYDLKVWLYDTGIDNQGYEIPEIDRSDFKIECNIPFSKLKYIYVLDNGYEDNEYIQWKKDVETLLRPLFNSFIAPPEPNPSLNFNPFPNFPFPNFLDSLETKLDKHAEMKNEIFFNALIIQID
ncbi:MAG: hypothetical protein PT119_25915 [Aphanizomenon gracile PMC627.10]|nr:hypothetical protein [Aphanizomenon gracile PMC627.10]